MFAQMCILRQYYKLEKPCKVELKICIDIIEYMI